MFAKERFRRLRREQRYGVVIDPASMRVDERGDARYAASMMREAAE